MQIRQYILGDFEVVEDIDNAALIERLLAENWQAIFGSPPEYGTVEEMIHYGYVGEYLACSSRENREHYADRAEALLQF